MIHDAPTKALYLYEKTMGRSFTIWLMSIVIATGALWAYEKTPGPIGSQPMNWPTNSLLHQRKGAGVVLLFVHPQCPCSAATLKNFDALPKPEHFDFSVVFTMPIDAEDTWKETSNVRLASRIPSCQVYFDQNGTITKQFGVSTSGHCLAYDSDHVLRFTGGLTVSRGHEGDNQGMTGLSDVLALTTTPQSAHPASYPIYGCPLHNDEGVNE